MKRIARWVLAAIVVGSLAACSSGLGSSPSTGCAAGAPCASVGRTFYGVILITIQAPVALTVGLGYLPSVQFAPFYLAQQNGYYADRGLAVTFQHKADPDLVTLVGQGSVDIGVADGTSVIPAVSQGIPIRYVTTGEKLDDIAEFDPQDYVDGLFE